MQIMNFSPTNCKNCYKCVRTCAVKAIEVKNDQAQIVEARCVACGHCLVACPQNARDIKSHLGSVKTAIDAGEKVVVSLAPSYKAYFKESDKFITGLKKLGFSTIEETARGAEVVSKAYEEYIEDTALTELITTCCPSAVRLIERYYPDLIEKMIPVVSPMIAHGKMIKCEEPLAYTVFIGPCISKIGEALSDDLVGSIDAVLTFDEITQCFEEEGIDYKTLEPCDADKEGTLRGDKYPVVGGVLNGIRNTLEKNNLEVLRVHGLENSKQVLKALRAGELKNVCIEMNICSESCIAGPGGTNQEGNIFSRLQNIQRFIREKKKVTFGENFVEPSVEMQRVFKDKHVDEQTVPEAEIVKVLKSMGKYEKKDELNCGTCGYDTCREKAVAVLNGMSQIEMCLPYMRSIAEKLSNEIFNNSPNSILIIDHECRIVDMNPVAEQVFGYKANYMAGKDVGIMFDKGDFIQAIENKGVCDKEKICLAEYDLIAYRHIAYLEKQNALLIIFTDITQEEKRKQEVSALKGNLLDVTQSIVDKQMRVAQEIASLLGETTAETKVAIMKLKKVLQEEGDY